MKAFILDRYGSADHVRAGDMPDPEVRKDDVLVQIHAAGVNLLDSKIRNGEFKLILPYRLPLILGHDVAGVVGLDNVEDGAVATTGDDRSHRTATPVLRTAVARRT
jgi:NADPH:quinone reductase-like Zn-dependent oxidoreductase